MHIVHVVEAWKGGIASYVNSLVKEQFSRGDSVTIIADRSHMEMDIRDLDVTVVNYKSSRNPLRFMSISRSLAEIIKSSKPDVVHCHSTFPGLYIRLRSHAAKVVYTPHGWSFFKTDVSFFIRCVYKFVEYLMAKQCDKIVCMSLEEVAAAKKLGLPHDKLSLIYTGIPFLPCSQALERKDFCEINVGFFGRFDYQKGFDYVESIASYLNDTVKVHLFGDYVRGEGHKVDSRFVKHGWIRHENIHSYIQAMDAVLIPSRWEGFALLPLEAMRASRPIIVSGCSSLPEVVIHGFNGIVVSDLSPASLADVLNKLDKKECHRMGENGAKVYEQTFQYKKFANEIDSLYRSG